MNYLITGGSGFIGSHLVERLLHSGHSVINIDNFDDFYDYRLKIKNTLNSVNNTADFIFREKQRDIQKLILETSARNYQLYYQDIRDQNGLEKIFAKHRIDAVIHLAALAGVRPSIERPLEYEEVNIRGTLNLWELCRDFAITKFINASSSSVYGNSNKISFSEDDNVDQPISPYAATKKCTEILGHVYHHLYHIDMIHLRFFTVYGPRQRPDLAIHKFARCMSKNIEIPFYGDGSSARDYTYIDEIIDGVLKALHLLQTQSNIFQIINLGGNEVVTLSEMVAVLEENLEKKAKKKSLPMPPGDVLKTSADITKARTLLGYLPSTPFQIGIKNFVEWFLKNGS